MNDSLIIVVIVLGAAAALLVAAAGMLARVARELRELRRAGERVAELSARLDELRARVGGDLDDGALRRRLEETDRVVRELTHGLEDVERDVRTVGGAVRELRALETLLRSPATRADAGDALLGELRARLTDDDGDGGGSDSERGAT